MYCRNLHKAWVLDSLVFSISKNLAASTCNSLFRGMNKILENLFLVYYLFIFLVLDYFSIWVIETKLRITVLTVSYQVFSQSKVLWKAGDVFIKYSIVWDYWWLSDMTMFFFLFSPPIYLFLLVVQPVEVYTPVRALHSLHLGSTEVLFDTSSMTHMCAPSALGFFASPIHFLKEMFSLKALHFQLPPAYIPCRWHVPSPRLLPKPSVPMLFFLRDTFLLHSPISAIIFRL